MNNLLAMTVAGSVIVGLMLLLRPVTVKLFPARWQYRIGKMAITFFLVPFSIFAGKLLSLLPQSITSSDYLGTSLMAILGEVHSNGLVEIMDSQIESHFPMIMENHFSIEVMQIILCIWLVGVVAFATWYFYCYRRFMKQIRANSIPAPENAADLLSSCKAELGIRGNLKFMINSKIASPMLVGLLHPTILLPISNMQEIDLKLVLTHELMHLKRKDLWIKIFALAAGTLHWFNPFAYILRKDISRWSELSCDEVLAIEMSHGERKLYGEAILNTLDNNTGINTAFCSSFCESKKYIERRLIMMLNVKTKKKYIAVVAVLVILAIGGIGMEVATSLAEDDIDNVTSVNVDEQAEKPIIGPTETKQVINVDVKSLDIDEFVTIGGPYTLEEGDIISYDITAEGKGNLNAYFRKTDDPNDDKGYLGVGGLTGNFMKDSNSFIVPKSLAGTYYLWIENFDGKKLDKNNNSGVLNNVKGTVEIAVESASK